MESRGVTLIELLVAVAIIVMCVAISAPSFIKLVANIEQRTFVRRVYSSLKLARAQAVIEGVNYKVKFDQGRRILKITKEGKEIAHLSPPESIKEITFSCEESASAGELLFYPKGNSTGGFIIIKANDTTYRLEIKRSGWVRVLRD